MTAEHDAQQPRGYWCREGFHRNCTMKFCYCRCHGKERTDVRRPENLQPASAGHGPGARGGRTPDDAGPAATLGSVQDAMDGLTEACRRFAEQEGIKATGWLLRDVLT